MRISASPLVVAVALGLLAPAVLEEDAAEEMDLLTPDEKEGATALKVEGPADESPEQLTKDWDF